jgi:pyruvate/2-oxoglutarate dehydrogenase complex dihydrolipoamide acyltransferase (E2) component
VIATPYAKQLAKKHKVDLKALGGSGPNGRITASDVEGAAGLTPFKESNGAQAPAVAPVRPVAAARHPPAAAHACRPVRVASACIAHCDSCAGSTRASTTSCAYGECFKKNCPFVCTAASAATASSCACMQASANGAVAVPPPSVAPAALAAAAAAGTTVEELRGTTTPFSAMEKSVAKNMQASLAVAEFRATVRLPELYAVPLVAAHALSIP